jgi:CheY-like chemotaxis protein
MTRLVNDLIDLSAVESGSFQLALRPAAPAEIVRQTVESLRPRAVAKGLELIAEVDAGVPAWVDADGGRWRQVLVNLAGNALKFTDRGRVTVALHAEDEPDDRVRLTLCVQDTGPGIPPAEQARLFTAFSRLEQTAEKEGSGLGLALSAALCRAMDGDLSVTSDGVAGSCFTACIRVTKAAAPAAIPAPAVRTGLAPRVVVVDDNRLVRELFTAALQAHGAQVRAAGSGAAGLARVAEERPDVLVLDLALPDGDGADLVPRFRGLVPGLRIIGVSAHAAGPDRDRALAAGMDVFLVKPVALDALWSAVAGGSPAPAALFDLPATLRDRLRAEFVRELPAQRAALQAALQAYDWPRVVATAHYLRNSALVVQASSLFEACTELESAAMARDSAGAARWWARCAAVLDGLAAA